MNKTAIKNFAVWARRKLIADITIKAGRLGITENGIAEALPQSTADLKFFDIGTKDYAEVSGVQVKQREALVRVIKEKERDSKSFKDAFEYVVEEVAYTWFNRLIAIRFMEVNDYLPSGIRVLSSENPSKNEPDFVTTPFETDLSFTPYEQDRVYQLKDENKWDELFRMLFIKQCNKLNEILPELFQKTEDYTELLLTISYSDTDGIVHHLVHDIDEKDFDIETIDEGTNKPIGQVEIIGWMYQYYISEKHEEVIDPLRGKTIKKEDIPAATQLFTTDWVVRYMVDNSLGRYWIERNPQSKLSEKLQFFVTPKSEKINYIDENIRMNRPTSPAFVYNDSNSYFMWYVEGGDKQTRKIFCAKSINGIDWEDEEKCFFDFDINPWHIDVFKLDNKFYLTVYEQSEKVLLFESYDGIIFSFIKTLILPSKQMGSFYKRGLYRTCLIKDSIGYKAYFSAKDGYRTSIGLIQGESFDTMKVTSSSNYLKYKRFFRDFAYKYFYLYIRVFKKILDFCRRFS